MEQITFDNVIEKLIEEFPEYKTSARYFDELNKDLHHIVLGNLSLMAFDSVEKNQDVSLAERLVKLTNEVMNNPDSGDELLNLFQIEVFERLVGSKMGARLAKHMLFGRSLDLLEQTLKHYHASEFLEEYRSV